MVQRSGGLEARRAISPTIIIRLLSLAAQWTVKPGTRAGSDYSGPRREGARFDVLDPFLPWTSPAGSSRVCLRAAQLRGQGHGRGSRGTDGETVKQLQWLGRDLNRERAHARRQWRRWEAIKGKAGVPKAAVAAAEWSETIATSLGIAELISLAPADDVAAVVVKFDAIWWWIVEDESLLDDRARVWLMRFQRSLHRLARNL